MVGVPLLMWKLLEEIEPGERVLIHRGDEHRRRALWTSASECWRLLAGAFVSEGWFGDDGRGFNNIDREFFDAVVSAYDEVVGGARYVYSRTIRSGSLCHELDVQNLTALRASPLAELEGLTSERKRVPEFVWSGSDPPSSACSSRPCSRATAPARCCRAARSRSPTRRAAPQLAHDVQQLLLEFGVISRLSRSARGEIKVVDHQPP